MSNRPGVHYLHERKQGTSKVPVVALRIRDAVSGLLNDFLQGAFDAVDDSLFELANNARNNNDQNRFFEAMREIRIKRRIVERHFKEQITSAFENPAATDTPSPAEGFGLSAENLSLLQNDDLEKQVAVNSMINKAIATHQGRLIPLQARFSHLYGRSPEKGVNPLSPAHLCKAFNLACQELDLQIRERLIVLKQFDRYIVSNLGMVYEETNRMLVQAGILTDYKLQARLNTASAQTKSSNDSTKERPVASALAPKSEEAFFDQVRQLLSSVRTSQPLSATALSASGRGETAYIVGGNELLDLLSHLPDNSIAANREDLTKGEPVIIDFRQTIRQLLDSRKSSEGKPVALSEMDEDLINLVAMLFEFILDDHNLSPPIQVLISRLQIPILKVVIKDRTFFSKPNHPARKLLNALARAGIGWSSSDERQRDKLYDQIHLVVQRILNEFDDGLTLFEQLNDEFDQFLIRENRKASIVEQRTQEAEKGRIKSQRAQEIVEQVLAEKVSHLTLPPVAHDILMNGWSRVMFLAYLRNDIDNRWKQSIEIVDDLIWCLRPHSDAGERESWVRRVPTLLRTLRAGLEDVSYNSSRLDELMIHLKQVLTEVFREQAAAHAEDPVTPATASPAASEQAAPEIPVTNKTAIAKQREFEDAAIAEHMARVDDIGIGNWVEFNLVNGTRFRCKLSAIIEDADCFVFVNRMGLKVVEKTRYDLAHEMRRGRLSILEQGALIDRALDAVMGSLKRKAS